MEAGFRGPDASPGEHGHASVFDFGFFEVLSVGEHVGEDSFDLVHFAKAHGVEYLAAEFGVEGGGEGGGGFGGGDGGEGGGGAD